MSLVADYIPRGAADSLMGCRALQVLMEGPAGTGKSRAVLQKLHYAALKYPGMRGLIVRKTRESLTESVLVTYEQRVLPPESPIANGARRNARHAYEYPNGSCIVVGGMKSNGQDQTAKIMSTEYDLVAAFESTELTEEDWEKLLTRLRNNRMPYQQAIADCNPSGPHHWLNQRANRGAMVRLLSRHQDNPVLFDVKGGKWTDQGEQYLNTLRQLTGARVARLLDGRWASAEGAVYEQFDADVHVIDPRPIPAEWRRIRAIDWGFTNPFACLWFAIDPDGRMYLYRELYQTKTIVEDMARQIRQLSAGERIEADVVDHDAEDRATYERHTGVVTRGAFKAINVGIQAVQARLRKAGDGKPRLLIFRDALVHRDEGLAASKKPIGVLEEFDGYVWERGKDGKSLKEIPVDESNHSLDALRYAVAYVDQIQNGPAMSAEAIRSIFARRDEPETEPIEAE